MAENDIDFETMVAAYMQSPVPAKVALLSDVSEVLIDDIIGDIRALESGETRELALFALIGVLVRCSELLGSSESKAYYDAFIRFLEESFDIQKRSVDAQSVAQFYSAVDEGVGGLEAEYPDSGLLKALYLDALERTAAFCVNAGLFDEACHFYSQQRNRLIDYLEIIDAYPFIAKADKNLVTPCVLSGNRDSARRFAEEAYDIYQNLYDAEPGRYALDLFEVCGNLGGLYLDDDELDDADRVFSKGMDVWAALPEPERETPDAKMLEHLLKGNVQKMLIKQGKSTPSGA